ASVRSRRCLLSALPRRRPSPPLPLLPPRERGEKDQESFLFYPLLSLGERRGRGGEGQTARRRRKERQRRGSEIDAAYRLGIDKYCPAFRREERRPLACFRRLTLTPCR